MKTLKTLFDRNTKWATRIKEENPSFFEELSEGQAPEYLWIGCSDSRVPANQIVDLPPGNLFVHRNIANVVENTDLNCLSVIQYAVEVLKVKHVIVCGHYGCGGVKASIDDQEHGLIDNWLRQIKDVHRRNRRELETLEGEARINRLCELNVIAQVKNVCETPIVKSAWKQGAELSVHGWIYGLEDGKLQDLDFCISSLQELEQAYPE